MDQTKVTALANATMMAEIDGAKSDIARAQGEVERAVAHRNACQERLDDLLETHAAAVTDLGRTLGVLASHETLSAPDLNLHRVRRVGDSEKVAEAVEAKADPKS